MIGWMRDAACKGMDPAVFFVGGDDGGSDNGVEAIAVCARCPVRAECLEYAVAAGEKFGIWGGLGREARAKIRRERREAAA